MSHLKRKRAGSLANGILTHNHCRCARVPVSKSWRDLGIDIPSRRASSRTRSRLSVLCRSPTNSPSSGIPAWRCSTRPHLVVGPGDPPSDRWLARLHGPDPLADLLKLAATRRAA